MCTLCAAKYVELRKKQKKVIAHCRYCDSKLKRLNKNPYGDRLLCDDCGSDIILTDNNVIYHCNCKHSGYDLCATCVTSHIKSKNNENTEKKHQRHNCKKKSNNNNVHLHMLMELCEPNKESLL